MSKEVIDQNLANVFARAYVDNDNDAFKASLYIWKDPKDTQKAIQMSGEMMANDLVKAAIEKLSSDSGIVLPTKTQFSKALWDRMKGAEPSEYYRIADLYARVQGLIEKGKDDGATTLVVPRVMHMPVFKDDAEWERETARTEEQLKKEVKRK